MIIPSDYQKLKTLPEDPEGCITYGKQTDNALCIVSVFPILPSEAMDVDGKEKLIDGIHHTLSQNQALIEVDSGILKSGRRFIYSIIKTHMDSGVQYFLLLHILEDTSATTVKGFFDEQGTTGIRDNIVFELYRRKYPEFNMKDWFRDPYDDSFSAHYLMNLSEQEQFDKYFPNHPLSVCRQLIKHIAENG